MQHSDERPPTSGRPSLLSSEQQVDADRHRILGALDDKSGPASMPGKRKYSWLAAGLVAVVAIGAGSAAWLSSEGEKEIVLANSAPLPATPAPAAPLASEPPAMNAEAEEVSTAAILQDVPGPEPKAGATESNKGKDELTSLLEKSSDEAGPLTAEVLAPKAAAAVAQAAPPLEAAKPAAKPAVKPAAKPAPKKVVVAKAQTEKKPAKAAGQKATQKGSGKTAVAAAPAKKKPEARKAQQQDTDVTLLAALVAHSKATAPKKPSTAADKLRQCKTLGSVAEAEQCRAKLCTAGAKNEPECKAPRLAKAPAAS